MKKLSVYNGRVYFEVQSADELQDVLRNIEQYESIVLLDKNGDLVASTLIKYMCLADTYFELDSYSTYTDEYCLTLWVKTTTGAHIVQTMYCSKITVIKEVE